MSFQMLRMYFENFPFLNNGDKILYVNNFYRLVFQLRVFRHLLKIHRININRKYAKRRK